MTAIDQEKGLRPSPARKKGKFNCYPLCIALHAFLTCSHAGAESQSSDAYLERAIGTVQHALTVPTESYGLVLMDTLTSTDLTGKNVTVSRERFSFYTKDGKVQFKQERYDSRRPSEDPVWRRILVSQRNGRDAKAVDYDLTKGQRTILFVNFGDRTDVVGREEVYFFHTSEPKNTATPASHPIQILLNPCFAPLVQSPAKLTPAQLRSLPFRKLSDKDGSNVYEIRTNKDYAVLLTFDPHRGDAISRSELRFGAAGQSKEGHYDVFEKWVRAVEGWQELSDGTPVPARFVMMHELRGRVIANLVREITNPIIGEIPDNMFDTSSLPEFKDRVTEISDISKQQRGDPNFRTYPARQLNGSLIALLVVNAVLLASLLIFLALRRRRRNQAE